MKRSEKTGQWLIAIFGMGVLALNHPILSLFTLPTHVAGVPLLYAYIFAAWAFLIALMAFVVERPPD